MKQPTVDFEVRLSYWRVGYKFTGGPI